MIHDSKIDKTISNRFKMRNLKNIVLFGFMVLFTSTLIRCANIQRPTGGPKDSLPPKLLNELPANFSRNFKERRIVLTFDEYIKLNNQFKEFSISPDVDVQPIFRVKKKDLIITLPDSLEENTTYTINFGKGLVDYNEGNPVVHYNYVFATGNELDSLSLSGSVKNGFTKGFDQKKDENIKVLLIPTSQDSIFGKKKANIFANVDTAGNFKFNNLRENTYRIYALKEQNNDRIFNGNDEWIGFLKDSIVLNKNTSGIQLELTKGVPQQFRTLEKKIENTGYVLLTFNQYLNKPATKILFPADLDNSKIEKFNLNNDTAKIYIDKVELDSMKIEISEMGKVIDTVLIRTNKNVKYDRELKPILNISNKVDKIKHIILTSSSPIASVDKSKIELLEDSVSRRNFQLEQDTTNRELYHIRFNWKPKRNYELVLKEKAIVSPFDDYNKEHKTMFTLDESDNYGNVNFTITNIDSTMQYIVELIDEQKEKVFDRKILEKGQNTFSYKDFPGGKYSLRVIYDANRNGRWDPGNVFTLTQAENIWYLGKTFTIRANWDQNETIELYK
ncbi:Ig-like domain-containing protein [Sphingobacterium psychroaquaticum]|uniref:Ig-like domain-containing protein n=2 Tax=Sphingobacterium psychroaquaticum TaxID=561061 RepID=A0A1X7KD46_9SPHI|nr:Ig-like domain-containing protein [Sphingobacterium psychroaquaticum]